MDSSQKDPTTMEGYRYNHFPQHGYAPEQGRFNDEERRRRLQRLTVLFAILAVISSLVSLTVTGLFLSINIEDEKAKETKPYDFQEVCVPCHHLLENPFESSPMVDQLQKREKDGIEECCVQNAAGMTALLNLMIRKPPSSKPARRENLKIGSVAAHKRLLPQRADDTGPHIFSHPQPLKFSQETTATEFSRGVGIEEDALVIKYSGVYYVHASLHFKLNSRHLGKAFDSSVQKMFYGLVYRQSPSDPNQSGDLLKIALSVCVDCIENQASSYKGGTFKLLKGDRIQIRTSGWNMLEFKPGSCYAGLVMLGSSNEDRQG